MSSNPTASNEAIVAQLSVTEVIHTLCHWCAEGIPLVHMNREYFGELRRKSMHGIFECQAEKIHRLLEAKAATTGTEDEAK